MIAEKAVAKSLLVLLIALGTGCTYTARIAKEKHVTVSDVSFRLYKKVIGGPHIGEIHTRILSYTCVAHGEPCTVVRMVKEPNKIYIQQTYTRIHKTFILGYDGSVGWAQDSNGNVTILSGVPGSAMRMLAVDDNECALLPSCDASILRLDDEKCGPRTCAVFSISVSGAVPFEVIIDKETGYPLAKREMSRGVWTIDHYSGLLRGPLGDSYPKTTDSTRADQHVFSATLISVKENLPISDGRFVPPRAAAP